MIKAKTLFTKLYENEPLVLECGRTLSHINVSYQVYGKLNKSKDNAVIVCHALTGNAHAAGILNDLESDAGNEYDFLRSYSEMNLGKTGWWDGLIGPGKAFDTEKYYVVCPNILGSCYGTTGPSSINPATGKSYNKDFPPVTVRDMVQVQYELLKKLGIKKLKAAAGGSLGGMQVLEWGIMYSDFVEYLFPIATDSANTAWAIALNQPAKEAIINDPDFNGGAYSKQPSRGLEIARMIGMISYRSDVSYQQKFGRRWAEKTNTPKPGNNHHFAIQSYLDYQGKKLVKRFDANTYLCVTNATDLHDVSRGRGSMANALGSIKARTLCIGISSDILYPPEGLKEIAQVVPGAEYGEVISDLGHDAFLIEFPQLEKLITDFITDNE